MADDLSTKNNGEIPPLKDLDSLLDELEQETAAEGTDPELGEAETDLDAEEELLLSEDPDSGSLDQLLAIAGRYPGLKITLSY